MNEKTIKEELFVSKEERTEKWFCNIPGAESLSMETKMDLCNKVARKMMVIFFLLLAGECILLFAVSGGELFNYVADFINRISEGSHTRNHYRGVALVGGLVCLPLIVLPLAVVMMRKNKWLQSELDKVTEK